MADKSIDQLNEAEKIYATDLFVLQQSGSAKKLTGQVLLNWLTAAADGHGGIQSIQKLSTSGLADTYRITLADTTTFDFVVNNGRGITGISKTSTSGLVDTYTISYNNGTTSKFTVTNGAKGDKGNNAYVWIKYASQEPTESSHSMGDIPDNWIGIYSGNASSAPSDWKQYKWFKHKGEKGDTGSPATLANKSVTYQVGDSGTVIPSGAWASSVPVVSPGKYLWTKTELQFNSGDPIVSYSVARMGIDGSGAVSSVCGVSPDSDGNVTLAAYDVGALPSSGGHMAGAINMNGQQISGLNDPTDGTHAARKGYVDASVRKAAPMNMLDNSDFRNPVNQIGNSVYTDANATIDRWGISADGQDAYCALTVNNGSITLNSSDGGICYLYQRFPVGVISKDKKYTAAYGLIDGSIVFHYGESISHTDNYSQIVLRALNGKTLLWAALYEGEYTADTLPEYHPKGYMVEALNCGALHVTTTATISTAWSGSGPYTQAVSVSGILTTDTPHIMPVYSTTNSTAIAQKEAWACVSKAETSDGTITFTCFADKPETAIPIQIEVNR